MSVIVLACIPSLTRGPLRFATAWNRQPALRYTPYIKKCCDILENQESCRGDLILAWQVRLQRIVEETHTMRRNAKPTDAAQVYQHKLMLKGMEAEMDQWETAMPQTVRSARTYLLPCPLF